MSWIERVESGMQITCGDGKAYNPNWMKCTKQVDWQFSEFNFRNIDGTLLQKGRTNGGRYSFDLYFQGEGYLDISDAFSVSSNDSRPWIISHPLYGRLNIQPVSMTFDNTDYNITKITGTFSETILQEYPQTSADPIDEIANLKSKTDESFINSLDSTPTSGDISQQLKDNQKIYNQGEKIVSDKTFAEQYFNAFSKANSAVLSATSEPIQAMRQVQAMINLPFQFQTSVENRIGVFVEQFNGLRSSLINLSYPSSKKIYQINLGTILGAMCVASSTTTPDDYINRSSVLKVVDTIISLYNQYIVDLDSIKTDNNGSLESFIPDFYAQNDLSTLISYTIANLFLIALGSKQERTYICESDTNIILLAHRFLGLDSDEKIVTMMNINNIGLNELLIIRKGRSIIYLV